MFDDPFDKYFDVPAGNAAGPASAAGGNAPAAPQSAGSSYPMTRAEAEALGYKPLLDRAPEIQPCEYGYPCNDCGYCH